MISLRLITTFFVLILRTTFCWDDYWSNYYHNSDGYYNYYPRYDDPYSWQIESPATAITKSLESCPEDESSWSRNDIVDMIHYVKLHLNASDITDDEYYKQAQELRDRNARKLEEFITKFDDRPHHMMHILEIIAETREKLEARVEDIVVKLQEFTTHKEKFEDVRHSANNTLELLEKYKEICQLNCGNSRVKTRLEIKKTAISSDSRTRYCFKLRDLYSAVYNKLSEYKENYEGALRHALEHGDDMYNERLENLKSTLKKIAIVKFGTTMYDILSLQDEYYLFDKYVQSNGISMDLDKIKNNNLDIEQKLIDLDIEVEKYRKYCTDCDNKRRLSQDIPVMRSQNYPTRTGLDIIDELILSEVIDQLHMDIKYDYMRIFEDLEEKLQNPNVINSYVENLSPVQREITYKIKNEESELNTLKEKIPPSLIAEISELLQESEELLDKLVTAKEYVSKFI